MVVTLGWPGARKGGGVVWGDGDGGHIGVAGHAQKLLSSLR